MDSELFPDSVQFSCSVVSYSLQPHRLQHARLPCPSLTPRVYSNSCPLSRWCHPTILHTLYILHLFNVLLAFEWSPWLSYDFLQGYSHPLLTLLLRKLGFPKDWLPSWLHIKLTSTPSMKTPSSCSSHNLGVFTFSIITLLTHPESTLVCSVKLMLIFSQAEKVYWISWPFLSYWNHFDFNVIPSKYIKLSLFSTFSLTNDVPKHMIF